VPTWTLIDFTNPAAPAIVATATLPFDPREVTRLANFRDELLALGPAGELVVIDPRTLGVLATFTLPSPRWSTPSASRCCWGRPSAIPCSTSTIRARRRRPYSGKRSTPSTTRSPLSSSIGGGGRFIFHQRGTDEWIYPNRLLPFTIAGPGSLVHEPIVELTVTGDFEMSGLVRTAGAKRLLVFTSESFAASHPIALPRLHDLDPVTLAGASYPLPLPLEPRGVFHVGAAIFADGFESGTTGAWGPTDL